MFYISMDQPGSTASNENDSVVQRMKAKCVVVPSQIVETVVILNIKDENTECGKFLSEFQGPTAPQRDRP